MSDIEDHDVSGQSVDEIAMKVTERLLVCENCERKNSAMSELSQGFTENGLTFKGKYTCEYCGFENRNTAVLE